MNKEKEIELFRRNKLSEYVKIAEMESITKMAFVCVKSVQRKIIKKQSGTTSGYQEVIMEEKEHLTNREKEILRWFGFSSKEIAKFLFISECTVKSHVHSILKKLKARTKSQAIILSLVIGEIKLDEIIKPPSL